MREVEWRGGEGSQSRRRPSSQSQGEPAQRLRDVSFFFFPPPSPPPSRPGTILNSQARPIPMINVINKALAAREAPASSPQTPPSCSCAKEQILQEFRSILKLR